MRLLFPLHLINRGLIRDRKLFLEIRGDVGMLIDNFDNL